MSWIKIKNNSIFMKQMKYKLFWHSMSTNTVAPEYCVKISMLKG